jgi:hypothetical protein
MTSSGATKIGQPTEPYLHLVPTRTGLGHHPSLMIAGEGTRNSASRPAALRSLRMRRAIMRFFVTNA